MLTEPYRCVKWSVKWFLFLFLFLASQAIFAEGPQSTPSIFAPASTPANSIYELSLFVIAITGGIFVTVGSLIAWAAFRYRQHGQDDTSEPAQIYGSTQVELAWTVIPILIVVVLFLTTARVIFAIQDAPKPKSALDVTVVGHQYWWEFNYPKLGIHAVNELHVPLSDADHPTPTYLTLLSADVMHSFWVPQLSGKTDLVPNKVNHLWIDPHHPGLYVGQCAQFCGVEHAKMLLRVYVDTPEQFAAWVKNQQQQAVNDPKVAEGRHVFETQACMNCHTIAGTAATGRFGPDLTHLMSRDTLASGATTNTPDHLREWIRNPDTFKPGSLMPAMQLSDQQLDQVTAYLSTLR
ncbi:MAG: cytochrome c oxidase subunit II [Acidobacterium ailaaui]|jgi:cytochrome c oxidase subunit 2|nr:cytochrome c oxidase subunit II [Pseudacidobacterium ailaaui]MCL6463126.1 cytochrome c oxidase subunit II [Pseudacidobacterium ailaaui]